MNPDTLRAGKMKIAIPVFNTKVSPRFDQTQGFVLLKTEKTKVVAKEKLTTKGWSASTKMRRLVNLGVDTLICGAIDRTSLQYLSMNGIRTYSWVTGEVDDAVVCFLEKRMKPGIILGEQGRMKGRWQFCRGRNHLCNRFRTGFYKGQEEVNTMPRGDGTGPKGKGPRSGKSRGGCKRRRAQGDGQGRRQGSDQNRDVGTNRK